MGYGWEILNINKYSGILKVRISTSYYFHVYQSQFADFSGTERNEEYKNWRIINNAPIP